MIVQGGTGGGGGGGRGASLHSVQVTPIFLNKNSAWVSQKASASPQNT